MSRRLVHISKPSPRAALCGYSPALGTRFVDDTEGWVKVCRDCAWHASLELRSSARTIADLRERLSEPMRGREIVRSLLAYYAMGGRAA